MLCNCDDPEWSNFWRYFHLEFERLGLKKLIATHYEPDEIPSYMMEYTGGNDEDFSVGVRKELTQNGDFRSPECIELLKEADIVVTNPPFSLFRPYIAELMEYDKEFLIIGSMNAITYKEVFPLLKENRVWLGYNSVKEFFQGDGTIKKFGNILWFTNLDIKKRHEPLETVYSYARKDDLYPDLYPKYDNYDAINVDKVSQIPMDYEGVMGVPITFLDKYCPEQFEIVGCADADVVPDGWQGISKYFVDEYYRQGNTGQYKEGNRLACYFTNDKKAKVPYKRVLVRKR